VVQHADNQGVVPDIAGILITNSEDGHPSFLTDTYCTDFISQYHVPVIESKLDTYAAALKINAIEVKINTKTPWKAERATELVQEHVALEELVAIFETRPS
jgi:hypothetical protein